MRGMEVGRDWRHLGLRDCMSFRRCQRGDDAERCRQIAPTGAPVRVKEKLDDPEELDWQELSEEGAD
jgi:hypothetical protein